MYNTKKNCNDGSNNNDDTNVNGMSGMADAKTGKGGDDFDRDGERIRNTSPPVFNKGIRQTPHNTPPQPESQGGSTGTLTGSKGNMGSSFGIGQFDPNSDPAPKVGNILDDRVQEMKKGGSGSNF